MPQYTNTKIKESPYTILAIAFITYLCLIIYHGYVYGSNDQIETIPLLFALDNPEIYSNDFFVQNIQRKFIHERWFFIQFLYFFHLKNAISILVLHAIFSMTLIVGIYKIFEKFLTQRWLCWIGILILLIFTYNINTGGNELYYNMLIPSLMAKSIAVWGIYFALNEKWNLSMIFITISCLFQPLVGIQVWLLTFLAATTILAFNKKTIKKVSYAHLTSSLIFILIAGPWLVLLFTQHSEGNISNSLIFEILEFRLSHHFFPAYFSTKGYLFMMVSAAAVYFFLRKKSPFLFYFSLWIILGCCIYTIGVTIFKLPLFLDTQWFKATIWLKAFGIISILGWLESKINFKIKIPDIKLSYVLLLGSVIFLSILKFSGKSFLQDRSYNFVWNKEVNAETTISKIANNNSAKEDVFIIPPDFTAFKWESKRNSYVDFKAMIHHKDVMAEWYDRVQEIYGMNLKDKRNGKSIQIFYKENWSNMNQNEWNKFKSKGVDFIISPIDTPLSLKKVTQSDDYIIYKL